MAPCLSSLLASPKPKSCEDFGQLVAQEALGTQWRPPEIDSYFTSRERDSQCGFKVLLVGRAPGCLAEANTDPPRGRHLHLRPQKLHTQFE